MTDRKDSHRIMKKINYSVLLLASAMLLSGCNLFATASDEARSGFASFSGYAIPTNEGKVIANSAMINVNKTNKIVMTASENDDDSKLFTGGAETTSTQQKISYETTLNLFSNYLLEQEMTYHTKTKSYGGVISETSMTEIERLWAGDPVDPAITGFRSLFSEETEINQEGVKTADNFRVNSAMYCQNGDIDNAWGLQISDVAGRIYSYTSEQTFYKTDDKNYVSFASANSASQINNPLFPGDDTKKIETNTYTELTTFFTRNASGDFYLSKMRSVQKRFALMDLELKPITDPLVISAATIEYSYSYDERKAGSVPTYVESPLSIPSVALCKLTNTGTVISSDYLDNVTIGYRLLNPSFTGYAYQATMALASSSFYAFSTESEIGAAVPNYSKWGFDNIEKTSILFGSITPALVSNYFAAIDGTYSILVLLNSNFDLSSIQVSYLQH